MLAWWPALLPPRRFTYVLAWSLDGVMACLLLGLTVCWPDFVADYSVNYGLHACLLRDFVADFVAYKRTLSRGAAHCFSDLLFRGLLVCWRYRFVSCCPPVLLASFRAALPHAAGKGLQNLPKTPEDRPKTAKAAIRP